MTIKVQLTCVETGIQTTMLCEDEIKELPIVHPLASQDAVSLTLARIARKGTDLSSCLSENTLAGMLLTVLRTNNLCVCRNPIEANQYLQKAGSETLARALRWFSAQTSFRNLPKLSLQDLHLSHLLGFERKGKSEAEILLETYLAACQGRKTEKHSQIIETPKEEKKEKGLKIFTDKVRQESSNLRESKERAQVLLSILRKQYAGQFQEMFDNIGTIIATLATVKESRRHAIADSLEMVIDASNSAVDELAEILRKASSEAIQKDLETVSSSIEAVSKDEKGNIKVDFLSKLQKKA